MTPSPQPALRRTVSGALKVLGLTLLAVAIWTSRETVSDALGALGHARLNWIAAAAATQIVVYLSHGELLQRLLRAGGTPRLGVTTCTELALVVFGLGGIMPMSPAEGMTLASLQLRRRGLAAGRAAGILALSEWVRFLVLAAIFAIDRVIAVANGRSMIGSVLVVIASSIAIVAMAAAADAFVRSERAAAWYARWRRRPTRNSVDLLLGSRPNRAALAGWAGAGWMGDALCLALCVRALGGTLGFDVVLLAFVVGSTVAVIPLLPGGLGVVEVAVPAIMSRFGLPLETAIAATFAWRGLSLLAPAAAGSAALTLLQRGCTTDVSPPADD